MSLVYLAYTSKHGELVTKARRIMIKVYQIFVICILVLLEKRKLDPNQQITRYNHVHNGEN